MQRVSIHSQIQFPVIINILHQYGMFVAINEPILTLLTKIHILFRFFFFFFFFLFFIFLFFFSAIPPQHMEVPRLGVEWSYSCQPTPQPEQCQIQSASATYTTAHGNARSPTHWLRPGIKPSILQLLVSFISAAL